MVLKICWPKNLLHFGVGCFVGAIGKTVVDRINGFGENKRNTLDGNELDIKYGIPNSTKTLQNKNYILGYNCAYRIPEWVLEVLSKDKLKGKAKRERCTFKKDPRVPKIFSSSNEDYHHSGFSRGHMACAGKYPFSYSP